jgi:hypothetical protein
MIKYFFLYTHASKTQEFYHKMNVVLVNLKANMGDECKHSSSLWMNDFFIRLMYMDEFFSAFTCF